MRLRLLRHWRRLALALCCVATPHAVRAAAPEVLFEDNFAVFNPDLGTLGEGQAVKDNSLNISVPGGSWNRKLYKTKRFADADVSLRVRIPSFAAGIEGKAGLIFWGSDAEEFYVLTATDHGSCGVFHRRRDYFRQPVSFQKIEAMKTEPGDWNELRVVTQGNLATLYVNGQQFAVMRGRPPRGGGLIGMYTGTGDNPITAQYAALKVVKPTGKPPLTLADDADDVLYAMNPKYADPAWGGRGDDFAWKDFGLSVKAASKITQLYLYLGDGAYAMDIAGQVRVNDGNDSSVSGVGFCFWGKNKNDTFMYYVSDDGKVHVDHYAEGKWTTHLRTPVPPEAKMSIYDWTSLHIVTEKNKANFFVNDVKVGVVFEFSPEPESQFGLVCDAGAAEIRGEFRNLVVRRLATAPPAATPAAK